MRCETEIQSGRRRKEASVRLWGENKESVTEDGLERGALSLPRSWHSERGQAETDRLNTPFEIRDSRWEIMEPGGQAEQCLSGPAG